MSPAWREGCGPRCAARGARARGPLLPQAPPAPPLVPPCTRPPLQQPPPPLLAADGAPHRTRPGGTASSRLSCSSSTRSWSRRQISSGSCASRLPPRRSRVSRASPPTAGGSVARRLPLSSSSRSRALRHSSGGSCSRPTCSARTTASPASHACGVEGGAHARERRRRARTSGAAALPGGKPRQDGDIPLITFTRTLSGLVARCDGRTTADRGVPALVAGNRSNSMPPNMVGGFIPTLAEELSLRGARNHAVRPNDGAAHPPSRCAACARRRVAPVLQHSRAGAAVRRGLTRAQHCCAAARAAAGAAEPPVRRRPRGWQQANRQPA